MLNSKTVHLVVLGLIVGAAAAYIFSSYQTNMVRLAEADAMVSAASGSGGSGGVGAGVAEDHPSVSEQEMLDLFSQALAVSPNDPELLSRFAAYLFSIERYAEAVEWFERLTGLTPDDATIRTGLATALYGSGRVSEAIQQFERALEIEPEQTLALHNLVLAYLEQPRDVEAAASALGRLESIDPSYTALPTLRERLATARSGA